MLICLPDSELLQDDFDSDGPGNCA